jgi:7-cyano-7-deazaguanine synthase
MAPDEEKRAVVLLSGGLDSATTLAIARDAGFQCFAMSFQYGQRHRVELERARDLASAMGVAKHTVVEIDLRTFGGSALTSSDLAVPKNRKASEIGTEIPVTYVPARNTIFLSFALAWAEVLLANDIFIGVNALDYSGYPDCRPEFLSAFQAMARLATRQGIELGGVRINAPLISWSKSRIIQEGLARGVDYRLTSSCYDPSPTGVACGACDACLLRLKGFEELGAADPIPYVKRGPS